MTVQGEKRSRGLHSDMDYKWTKEEEAFEEETAYANQGPSAAGIVLYRIVWQGYQPAMEWYKPAENLGSELLRGFKQSLAADAAAEEASLPGRTQSSSTLRSQSACLPCD
eukprot:1349836-Pleurochrysis_carterae.AAC.5